ncbi:hypothetical protein [Pseudosulfitobacter pseudonitzschiae]|uniref:hypothetical protein n=1 Tax=Pseudosulfitobacter pseudonitzschiae TaxID=1402135 RepID=UPI003B7ED015
MDFSITKKPGVAGMLAATVAALSLTSGSAAAESDFSSTTYPGALMQRACMTSGAVAKMQETGGYDLNHLSARIGDMNTKIDMQKKDLNEVGVAVCDEIYRIGYAQAANGLWSEASVAGSLNVIEMDAQEFGHLVSMAKWSSPADVASDELNGMGFPNFTEGREAMVEKAYHIEALAGSIEFASYVNLYTSASNMTVEQAKQIIRGFENEDFGPGDNFSRYGVEYMNSVSPVMIVSGGIASIDTPPQEREIAPAPDTSVADPLIDDEVRKSTPADPASGIYDI